mgnify:CR=1 FL=1
MIVRDSPSEVLVGTSGFPGTSASKKAYESLSAVPTELSTESLT